jgi:uncharacterized 2Fe-2S/4Fe-4S cluster protein (DUF4445 family)
MDYCVLENLHWKIEMEPVLKTMDCYEDSPVYEEVVEEYEENLEDMKKLVKPVGILGMGKLSEATATEKYKAGTPVIFAVLSVGSGLKEESTRAFQEGNYVQGMLVDAMADAALFSMDNDMVAALRQFCAEHKVGIEKRLEAPHDISMEAQKEAWETLELEKRFGIKISSGFMFDPVKTSCQVFILSENEQNFKAQHDCRNCNNFTCKLRNVPPCQVTVSREGKENTFLLKDGQSLMEGLIEAGYQFSAACGGKGRCGKCRVQLLEGNVPATAEDESVFSEKELAEGWRLSCRMYPKEDIKVGFALNDESRFEVLGGETAVAQGEERENAYDVAVDIGTTTIAMEIIGCDSGRVLGTAAFINSQRVYGADVITRIKASMDGKKEELRKHIRQDLGRGLKELVKKAGISLSDIRKVIISGNTTMGHLLMGYDCDSLGVFPFTPVNIDFIRGTAEEILGIEGTKAEVVLLPGISTYVGGDIVSGLYACGFDREEEICMLIDLGTNGEMGIGNREKMLVTSTAAGPAFEGGNISWGAGSVAGAICSVKINGADVEYKTIQDEAPMGICGTGVVETVAELVKEELVDEMGSLDEDYFDDGFPLAKTPDGREIVFTQQDVREIQLAKAAIRAGVETLVLRYGITKEQVKKVYVAGGFGYKLDKEKAIAIGMLPEEFADKIETVGNSSLAGARQYLRDADGEERLSRIVETSEEIGLSTDKDFNEFYMDGMMFGEE